MSKRIQKIPLKILYYTAFSLFIYVLQTAVFSRLSIRGAKPIIFPLVVAGAAMFEGSINGGIIGLITGMLCDISYNQPTIQFTLILMFLGIFIGFIAETVFARGFPTFFLSSIFALCIFTGAQIFGPVLLRGIELKSLLAPCTIQICYTLIFLIPVYITVRSISRHSTR